MNFRKDTPIVSSSSSSSKYFRGNSQSSKEASKKIDADETAFLKQYSTAYKPFVPPKNKSSYDPTSNQNKFNLQSNPLEYVVFLRKIFF